MTTPLFENILAQPSAIETAGLFQLGDGRRDLLRAAEIICRGRRVILTGMGASLFACIPLQYALAVRGTDVSIVETAELLHFLDAQLTPDVLAVLVSRSGESVEVVKLLDLLGRRGCKAVGITNTPGSTLAKRAQASVLLQAPVDQLVAIQSYQATLVTLAFLGAACAGEMETAAAEFVHALSSFKLWIDHCISASTAWNEFADSRSPLYILSRGPSMASVAEGVLLMHEAGKTSAVGLSSAQFRHGPVEVVDWSFRAVIIGAQDSTREIDWGLARDLVEMEGQIRWIGPSLGDAQIETLGVWPNSVPERFAASFEIVPLQLLAYRTAETRGFVPGDFRWAPLVTNAESGFPGLSKS